MKYIYKLSRNMLIITATAFSLSSVSVAKETELTVAYIKQVESVAKSQMLKQILALNTDYKVTLVETKVEDMWSGIAQGKYDASVSVMLPEQAEYLVRFKDEVEDLGPNWIGEEFTIHTIVRKNYEKDDVQIVRFLNNYCLCGERLESVMMYLEDDEITLDEAREWSSEHQAWIGNMMGFVRPFDDREKRGVTY
jgi:ABC-type proline/glycine betaine transport system substrate-binding protein